ncbi:MAG: ribosome maturation factor RimM [Eubacteriales bacterium]|nr:ribosome maturation factor RimM [Eubacteriales bacterium]
MSFCKYLECGKITNTHGVHGSIKVACWCNTPKDLACLGSIYFKKGEGYEEIKVIKSSVYKDTVIMTLEGITTPEDAERLKNKIIYADRDNLKVRKGEVFLADIIGLEVRDADTNEVYGVISEISKSPASYIYTVKTADGTEVLIPAVKEFIKETDTEKGIMFIRPISGFFDEI